MAVAKLRTFSVSSSTVFFNLLTVWQFAVQELPENKYDILNIL